MAELGGQKKDRSILMMAVDKEVLLELCDLFPQTAENIKYRALERRTKFMHQRENNSNYHYSRRQLEKFGLKKING